MITTLCFAFIFIGAAIFATACIWAEYEKYKIGDSDWFTGPLSIAIAVGVGIFMVTWIGIFMFTLSFLTKIR